MQRALVSNGQSWSILTADPLSTPGLRWVDFEDATEEEFLALERVYGFHPLAVEDCRHLDQRSKLEDYTDHTFVVLHVYADATGDPVDLKLQELHAFVRADLLVTVHKEPMLAIQQVHERALKGDVHSARTPGSVLYSLADALVDQMFPVVESLAETAERLAEEILFEIRSEQLLRLLRIKRAIMQMRKLNGPAHEVLGTLSRMPIPGVAEQDLPYFRNVLDHLYVLAQEIDITRELIGTTRELYLSAQSARVNEVVKHLSAIATLGLPLTFITGFFGMNFAALPFDSVPLMWGAMAAMAFVPSALLGLFKWRRWI
jgi:magnesium transporter